MARSLQLGSSGFLFCGSLKKLSERKCFSQEDEMKAKVQQWEQTLSPSFFFVETKLAYHRNNFLSHSGDYKEK
jgi:hypothetical protein